MKLAHDLEGPSPKYGPVAIPVFVKRLCNVTKLRHSEDSDVHYRGRRVALKELIDKRIDWEVKIYSPGMDP